MNEIMTHPSLSPSPIFYFISQTLSAERVTLIVLSIVCIFYSANRSFQKRTYHVFDIFQLSVIPCTRCTFLQRRQHIRCGRKPSQHWPESQMTELAMLHYTYLDQVSYHIHIIYCIMYIYTMTYVYLLNGLSSIHAFAANDKLIKTKTRRHHTEPSFSQKEGKKTKDKKADPERHRNPPAFYLPTYI